MKRLKISELMNYFETTIIILHVIQLLKIAENVKTVFMLKSGLSVSPNLDIFTIEKSFCCNIKLRKSYAIICNLNYKTLSIVIQCSTQIRIIIVTNPNVLIIIKTC